MDSDEIKRALNTIEEKLDAIGTKAADAEKSSQHAIDIAEGTRDRNKLFMQMFGLVSAIVGVYFYTQIQPIAELSRNIQSVAESIENYPPATELVKTLNGLELQLTTANMRLDNIRGRVGDNTTELAAVGEDVLYLKVAQQGQQGLTSNLQESLNSLNKILIQNQNILLQGQARPPVE